ncbi:MAG: hypothetical protein ACPG8W_02715 [Candidatus Promineifilaceae bacterium]
MINYSLAVFGLKTGKTWWMNGTDGRDVVALMGASERYRRARRGGTNGSLLANCFPPRPAHTFVFGDLRGYGRSAENKAP